MKQTFDSEVIKGTIANIAYVMGALKYHQKRGILITPEDLEEYTTKLNTACDDLISKWVINWEAAA